jgi:hypothetical protein
MVNGHANQLPPALAGGWNQNYVNGLSPAYSETGWHQQSDEKQKNLAARAIHNSQLFTIHKSDRRN